MIGICRTIAGLFFAGGVFCGIVATGAAGDDAVEFALDELTAYHGDVVDVEFALQVVTLVLNDAGEEA